MFIELHLIQNFAPANLNRDDTGSPKDCSFGGHRRARISSQALKRAIRFEPIFRKTTAVGIGTRTKRILDLFSEPLLDAGKDAEEVEAVVKAFALAYLGAGAKMESDDERSNMLLYVAPSEAAHIVQLMLDNWDALFDEKGAVQNAVAKKLVKDRVVKNTKGISAPDIALFGRMLAGNAELNIDAACQVAHAISTHRVTMEMDYFTAVDDLKPKDNAGASMVGFTTFNSSCFYRYARIDWALLSENLGNINLARLTVEAFLRAALVAIPTGKQTSFAAQNPTDLALATVRDDGMSWNLANAFEQPIQARGEGGLVSPSIHTLDDYWSQLKTFYDDTEIQATSVHTLRHAESLQTLSPHLQPTLSKWISTIVDALPQE